MSFFLETINEIVEVTTENPGAFLERHQSDLCHELFDLITLTAGQAYDGRHQVAYDVWTVAVLVAQHWLQKMW